MTGLTTDILLIMLKSQLDIENSVLEALKPIGYGTSNDTARVVTNAKIKDIRRQISAIENADTKQKQ